MSFNPIKVVDKFAPEDMDKGPIAVLNLLKFKAGGEASYKRNTAEWVFSLPRFSTHPRSRCSPLVSTPLSALFVNPHVRCAAIRSSRESVV
jgi:hypothetical protein